jgi:hypothetical protein
MKCLEKIAVAIGLIWLANHTNNANTEIKEMRDEIAQLRAYAAALDEKIKFERQDSYSSYEDLRQQFADKSISLIRTINDLEKKKKK